jgi:hypothetical protein
VYWCLYILNIAPIKPVSINIVLLNQMSEVSVLKGGMLVSLYYSRGSYQQDS